MKYTMKVTIAQPNTPEGMSSDILFVIDCIFVYDPEQYGKKHYLYMKKRGPEGFENYIDLRYDGDFDRNDKPAYLEKWAKAGNVLSCAALECPIGESSFQYKWHMNFSQVVDTVRRFKEAGIMDENTLCYVNHISQEFEDKYYREYTEFAKPYGILVPYDGLTVTLKED